MSNILSLPLVQLTVQTGNNEDWIDCFKYVSPADGQAPTEPAAPQVDIRGIKFEMEMRRAATDHEVLLSGSTDDGSLSIGASPDYGYLIIFIQSDTMQQIVAGTYVADIVGSDDQYARKIAQMDITIVEGVTKWPSPA